MNRYTFVVQVHPGGISTLENLSTHECVRVSELSVVGPQIERWLAEASEEVSPVKRHSEPDRTESTRE
jgi:hypothetical protein